MKIVTVAFEVDEDEDKKAIQRVDDILDEGCASDGFRVYYTILRVD